MDSMLVHAQCCEKMVIIFTAIVYAFTLWGPMILRELDAFSMMPRHIGNKKKYHSLIHILYKMDFSIHNVYKLLARNAADETVTLSGNRFFLLPLVIDLSISIAFSSRD